MANIVIRDLDEELVAQLKDLTGEKTNSKALIEAAKLALGLVKDLETERAYGRKCFEHAMNQQKVLDSLESAMKEALELVGQGDLFNQENGK